MRTISENDAICLIKSNDLSQLIAALRSSNNYLPIYDALCQAPIELPYCLFKAWNTYDRSSYMLFAETSNSSRFGYKYLFKAVLKQFPYHSGCSPTPVITEPFLTTINTYIDLFKLHHK